eukprot:CAMPEP_0117540194 /NCGR_PEP_ID=MMETSP0784-20121206/43374_1 /TAXON_ID=39447 /ORGANISM="" /LENGTH=347 /DNA_ID=CAMNT_0005336843 /DNA_START=35 /DNA_END=1075 /DNA_ORIENTATION=+
MVTTWGVAAVVAVLLWPSAATHYTCTGDDITGEVQGETGTVCGPKCREGGRSFDCPTDVPDGTSAQPQCMLQDVDQNGYCGLLCQTDLQCPSGASCRRVGGVGMCIHSLSFADWAKQGSNRKKLSVGWSADAGQSQRGFQIAKAYAALQNLKKKYGIQDGDADVLLVKELLSAASTQALASASNPSQSAAPALAATTLNSMPSSGGTSAPPPAPSSGGWLSPWTQDVAHFESYVKDGLPGLQREAHDIVWNLERLNKAGVSEGFLRGIIWIGLIYLIIGSAYKYQTMGARGKDMIPHIGFWMEYPQLVADGIRYMQILVGNLVGKHMGGSGVHQPRATDRDSFAHFE